MDTMLGTVGVYCESCPAGTGARRSWDHRGSSFPGAGRTSEDSLPETPLSAKREGERGCPGFALPPSLPQGFPLATLP